MPSSPPNQSSARMRAADLQTILAGVLLTLVGAGIDSLSWGQHVLSHAPAAAITGVLLAVGALIASTMVEYGGKSSPVLAGVLVAAGSTALAIALPITIASVVGLYWSMPMLEILTYVGFRWPALIMFGFLMLGASWALLRRARQLIIATEEPASHTIKLMIIGMLGFFVAFRGADAADTAWIRAQFGQVTQDQPGRWPSAFDALSKYPLCTPRRCRAFACDRLYELFGAKKSAGDHFKVPVVPPEHEVAIAPYIGKPGSTACISMR